MKRDSTRLLAWVLIAGLSVSASVVLAGPTTTSTTTTTAAPTTTTSTTTTTVAACSTLNPVTTINTIGGGQSPSNNPKLSHNVTGNIVGAGSLGSSVTRIPVCAGTSVSTALVDSTGTPTVTKSSAGLSCSSAGCSGTINATEKYTAKSADGKDTDTLTFLPQ